MVNEDNICGCGREIEEARLEYGFKNCAACAHSGADVPRPKGRMVYSHKTGAEIEILSAESWKHSNAFAMFLAVPLPVRCLTPSLKSRMHSVSIVDMSYGPLPV